MATDYDATRKSEEELKEETQAARLLVVGEQDKTSPKLGDEENEIADSFELPGQTCPTSSCPSK